MRWGRWIGRGQGEEVGAKSEKSRTIHSKTNDILEFVVCSSSLSQFVVLFDLVRKIPFCFARPSSFVHGRTHTIKTYITHTVKQISREFRHPVP